MIIECKCKKYKFKIPDNEISAPGRNVQCSVCNEEWYQSLENVSSNDLSIQSDVVKVKEETPEIDNKDAFTIDDINPSKIKEDSSEEKIVKIKKSNLLLLTVLFLILLFVAYNLAFMFKDMVLIKYPDLKNAYGALEIVGEIVKTNFDFIKNLISEKINNI